MKKIKIAQIGINQYSHSNEVFNSIFNQSDLFEVVGIVFPEHEKQRIPQKLQCFDNCVELSLDEVLSNPEIEAVTIETDEIYLTKYAILAAKAGKHIHMEKPGSVGLADFEKLISIMRVTGNVFHIGYMYRYNPYISELICKAKRGDFGEILSVEAQMSCMHPPKTRQWLKEFPGGMMFFLGCHLVDLILQIKGVPQNIIPYNKCSTLDGVTSNDFCMTIFEYANGVSFAKTTAVEIGGFERRQLVVSGTKATVELKPLEWFLPDLKDMQTHRVVRSSNDWFKKSEKEISASFDRYENMMRSFAKYVRGEKQNPYSLDYELELYKSILKACGESNF